MNEKFRRTMFDNYRRIADVNPYAISNWIVGSKKNSDYYSIPNDMVIGKRGTT